MNKDIEETLKKNPLQFFDTVVFLSASGSDDAKQDFAIIGDTDLIIKHIAAMCLRHNFFDAMLTKALLLADASRPHYKKDKI